ncbi:MAG: hypothetical protein MUE39_10030 [Gammaproteobacteria bacterium]|jgi:hypothetical protein|nr:hypothetical protein [Gammaproteobacteria bacterium]
MGTSPGTGTGEAERRRLNFTEPGLEADIAFLEAVAALVGRRPATTYQTAQVRACATLAKALTTILHKARNRRRAGDPRRR